MKLKILKVMKFKSLFFSMLVAAAIVSCNNDVIGGGNGDSTNPDVIEGIPTYATFDLVPKSASTYAGDTELTAEAGELNLQGGSAALMIYDNSNAPKAYAFITNLGSSTTSVTLKTTSGTKKLFLAANIGTNPLGVKLPNYSATSTDEGADFAVEFADMNRTMYSSTNDWDTVLPTNSMYKADNLIKRLAGGAQTLANGVLHTTTATTTPTGVNFVMANWDGPTDAVASGTNYASTCTFTLIAEVPKNETQQTSGRNRFTINVQRAVAKIALRITAGATGVYPDQYYIGGAGEAREGHFIPIKVNNNPIWVTGNIHKEAKVFQNYTGGVVQDHNALQIDDSMKFFAKWRERYDNTRFFGETITSYPSTSLKVADVESTMKNTNNYQELNDGASSATWSNRKYTYVPENARKAPVSGDYATYVVVLGEYVPKTYVRNIYYPAVAGGTPLIITTDGYTTSPSTYYSATGQTYTNTNTGLSETINYDDTLYYLNKTGEVYFFVGQENLIRYYAWVKKFNINATAANVSLKVNVAESLTEINQDMANGFITGYTKGKCFYRVYISNTQGPASEFNIVRRNHVYQVDITKILGPGIADPNDVITPKPLSEADTYVTAVINVLNWHVVSQKTEVGE
jgi:hypothetical protein